MKRSMLVAAVLVGGAAASAGAQVGHPPELSPYRDLEYRQELSLLVGPYSQAHDPAGVAPGGGLLTGIRYGWRAAGPAILTAELAHITSNRMVLDPSKPAGTRELGERSWPLYSANIGLDLALTGAKSWHQLVPIAAAGAGVISDFKSDVDVGGFKFGTRFALTWGAGVRWVPGGRWSLRADVTNRLYSVKYPATYFTPASSGEDPVLEPNGSNSSWTNNPTFSIGISYLFSR